jgi:hypothetical protein
MGIALAGVAFRPVLQIESPAAFVAQLFGQDVVQIEPPDRGEFDIRRRGDVMVEFFGDVCFIFSHDLVWEILSNPSAIADSMVSTLGTPDLLLAFCHYDSGGSHGYAFFEHGIRTRTRLQTTDVPGLPPIIESGQPKDFELRWLTAPSYFEEDDCPREEWQKVFVQNEGKLHIAECHLTRRMLYEALISSFGICPWERDVQPVSFFFRLRGI